MLSNEELKLPTKIEVFRRGVSEDQRREIVKRTDSFFTGNFGPIIQNQIREEIGKGDKLSQTVGAFLFGMFVREAVLYALDRKYYEGQPGLVIFAKDSITGKDCGCFAFGLTEQLVYVGEDTYHNKAADGMLVHPDFRNQNIGSTMIQELKMLLNDFEIKKYCTRASNAGAGLMRKNGFTLTPIEEPFSNVFGDPLYLVDVPIVDSTH
jgi:GNAT superfamily N-acetyltransferase